MCYTFNLLTFLGMKNLLTLLCVAVLAFANVTFAQYGGGSSRSGGSSSVLVKDTCPDGDTSGSYFDNSCGDEDMMDDDMMDDDMMDDDTMDVEEEIEDNNEEIIDENEEDMMDDDMDDNIGMSLFDALKDRG